MVAKVVSFVSNHIWKVIAITACVLLFVFGLLVIVQTNDTYYFRSTQVVLVNAIFAAGDRSVERVDDSSTIHEVENYNLPFVLSDYLSEHGKQQETLLGKYLKKRYAGLLHKNYSSKNFKAYTDTRRLNTMSLALVLEQFFPRRRDQDFQRVLRQQQTRDSPEFIEMVSKVKHLSDEELQKCIFQLFNSWNCTNYASYLDEYISSGKAQPDNQQQFLSQEFDGNSQSVLGLYFTVKAANNAGLELPKWIDSNFTETLEKLALQEMYTRTGTEALKKFAAGYLLQQLVSDFKAKINDSIPDMKMILYSTDEYNIAEILLALDIFDGSGMEIPNSASCILIELHKANGTHWVKIFYRSNVTEKPVLLSLPGCEDICSFEKFEIFAERYFPEGDLCRFDDEVVIDLIIWNIEGFIF